MQKMHAMACLEAEWQHGMLRWLALHQSAVDGVRADMLAAQEGSGGASAAKLAQRAFVPRAGVALQEVAQRLRLSPEATRLQLASWRSSVADQSELGDLEAKSAIEAFSDSFFTVVTLDDRTHHAVGDAPELAPAEPSPPLTHCAVVHRGPVSGGHLKLFLREMGGRTFATDFTTHRIRLRAHDWGTATPLAAAAYAYPCSGGMRPTVYRFLEAKDGVQVPDAATAAADLAWSFGGDPTSGSGWVPLAAGSTAASAYAVFLSLAARRWGDTRLYNCRSFVREMLGELLPAPTAAASVEQMFDDVFRFVVLEREPGSSFGCPVIT